APKPRRVAGVAKTMLGVPTQAPVGAPAEPAPEPAPEPSASDDEGHEEAGGAKPAPHRRIAGSARTMLGMPAPDRAAVAQAVAEAKARNAAREASEGTERGLGPAARAATAAVAPPVEHAATERGLGPAASAALEAADTIDEAATRRAVGSDR